MNPITRILDKLEGKNQKERIETGVWMTGPQADQKFRGRFVKA